MKEKYFNQPSVMTAQQHFSQVPKADIQRSRFDRSHALKTTFDAGLLIPVFVDEVLPGDSYNVNQTAFCRLATPLKPIMDNIYLDTQFFFVPYRLVWDHWENFMGQRDDPDDDPSVYTIPQRVFSMAASTPGTLQNYFGIPYRPSGSVSVSALPFRAYALIYNEWYRDQNLQDRVAFSTGDGPDTSVQTNGSILRRGKRHDYFTSCLPWPQKGTAVSIPLGSTAPINTTEAAIGLKAISGGGVGSFTANVPSLQVTSRTGTWNTDTTIAFQDPFTALEVDLTGATAATINQLRESFQIQKLYERDARGGTRYTEIIRSHFGVTSPDARLQRPEYLGGGSQPVNINAIAQTSSTDGTSPQGNLAATGIMSSSGQGFVKSFTEHCVIIGLVNVRADLNYQQGLNRMYSRRTRWDFYWPALSHIGEQAVLNKEIYAQGSANPAQDVAVFGYQERYAEYRYKPSVITGQFRSTYSSTLDIWHLAQDFASLPALNATFIVDNPPVDRVIATPAEPHFLFDAYFNMVCTRPMPTYSVPGLIDHF